MKAATAPWPKASGWPQAEADQGQARDALKRVAAGEPLREIALPDNVDHSTICRLKARYAAEV